MVTFPGIRGVQGYLLGRPEVGRVNLRALERHHEYLEAHRRKPNAEVERTQSSVTARQSNRSDDL